MSIGERETADVASLLLDCAALLSASKFKKWKNWGRSYVNRTAAAVGAAHPALAGRLLTERFGAEKAAKILSGHGAKRRR